MTIKRNKDGSFTCKIGGVTATSFDRTAARKNAEGLYV